MAWSRRRRPGQPINVIDRAVALMAEIDRLMAACGPAELDRQLALLKSEIDQVNMLTVCDKSELNLDVRGPKLRYPRMAQMVVAAVVRALGRRVLAVFHRLEPATLPPKV